MESNLTEPLLNAPDLMSSSKWPQEAAKRAKLLIPKDYDAYQSEPSFCHVELSDGLIKFISSDTQKVLDIIDPQDMIGAAVEVELLGADSPSEPRAVAFQNRPSPAQGPSSPVVTESGIFRPLDENSENIFSFCNNEPTSEIPFDSQATAVFTLYVYPRIDPSSHRPLFGSCGPSKPRPVTHYTPPSSEDSRKMGHRHEHHRRFQVAPAEDFADISAVVRAIRQLCRPTTNKGDKLLVIVNPFSGRKLGEKIYKDQVQPMLENAGIEYDSIVTTHARHAEELVGEQAAGSETADISKYDGVVAVGGDGMVHEILQGIYKRSDYEAILKRLKLGHIGAGTSNGLSMSLAHASEEHYNALNYAFMVAKGKATPIDLSRYETQSSSYLSFLTFSWSIIADIDIESEAIRWMGFLRMDIWAVWRVLNLRKYRAKFSYLPPNGNRVAVSSIPPLNEPLPSDQGWTVVEDDFVLFWASQVTHAAEQTHQSPHCKLDDGVFSVFIVRKQVSRLRLALILLAMEHGGHVDMDGVEFITCTAYRLEAISPGSFNDLDGEVIEPGPVQGVVMPGAIQAYCNL